MVELLPFFELILCLFVKWETQINVLLILHCIGIVRLMEVTMSIISILFPLVAVIFSLKDIHTNEKKKKKQKTICMCFIKHTST